MALPKSIINLSETLSSLPGVGNKLSHRIALYLSINNKKLATSLANSLTESVSKIRECVICSNVTESTDICEICEDSERNSSLIMVVESPLDLYTIEESGNYSGLYHVLKGVISPVNGVGPDDLTIDKLLLRIKKNNAEELIYALNPDLEGDSTSLYIKAQVENMYKNVKQTILAKGIPSGASLEYMSSSTINESLKSRSAFI